MSAKNTKKKRNKAPFILIPFPCNILPKYYTGSKAMNNVLRKTNLRFHYSFCSVSFLFFFFTASERITHLNIFYEWLNFYLPNGTILSGSQQQKHTIFSTFYLKLGSLLLSPWQPAGKAQSPGTALLIATHPGQTQGWMVNTGSAPVWTWLLTTLKLTHGRFWDLGHRELLCKT